MPRTARSPQLEPRRPGRRAARLAPLLVAVLGAAGCGYRPSNNPRNELGLGPATVALGEAISPAAAHSYAVLARTGIRNTNGSSVSGGGLGLSPANASAITGFALSTGSSRVYSTSPSVAGRIYAASHALPSPVFLDAAIVSMEQAYADAASRTPADVIDLGGGNLGGRTLTPGLYAFGSGVTIPTDVTFSGGPRDIWILQVANDLELGPDTRVRLSGGAMASHIFWQVSGQTTLRGSSHLEGVILGLGGITLQTAASLHGRALTQSLVTLDESAVTAP